MGISQYFQQQVDFTMNVVLEDNLRTVTAEGFMYYTNNSNTSLDTIYFHLWANAFQGEYSAFAEQQLKLQSTDFIFSSPNEKGGFDEFKIEDGVGRWVQDHSSKDIGYILLNDPLQPGSKINISFQFILILPHQFSRLGVRGDYIQLSHWYPKPAVYDKDGWHSFPYLAMGEFYSEFGSYEITLSIPENLRIASTGNITKLTESKGRNTYQISARNVIDVALVCHPGYIIDEKEYIRRDGSSMALKIFHDANDTVWADSAMYFLESSVAFYEEMVGVYPFPHLTVVQQNGRGGGMEYPMLVTVSAEDYKTLNYYINHEVGHQWFYGVLAFNEREHPYLDEGLTTFFEHIYTISRRGKDYHTSNFPENLTRDLETPILQQGYLWQKRRAFSEPASTDPGESSMINYGLNAYEKAAYLYSYLDSYISRDIFIEAIASFYNDWKFKHPSLEDMIQYFEAASGKDCNWIADLLRNDEDIDFRIIKRAGNTYVANLGTRGLPFHITTQKGESGWHPVLEPGTSTEVESDALSVNADFLGLEVNGDDNHIDKGNLKMVPFFKLDNSQKSEIYFAPMLTWNYADGLSLGTAFYNSTFPSKRFQYLLAPQFSLSSKDVTGNAWLAYNLYPDGGKFRKIQFKLSVKRYNYFFSERNDYRLNYSRFVPQVSFHFKGKSNSQRYNKITLRTIFLRSQTADFLNASEFAIEGNSTFINQVKYEFFDFNILNRKELNLLGEQRAYTNVFGEKEDYIKIAGAFRYQYKYNTSNSLYFKVFAAGFLRNSQRGSSSYDPEISAGSIALFHQGFNDYTFEEYFLNRQQGDAPFTNQVSSVMGGFKDALGPQYGIGQSNDIAASVHFSADLPMNMPFFFKVRPYIDIGYYRSRPSLSDPIKGNTMYSGGLMLSYLDGALEIYFPLFSSQKIRDIYDELGENVFQKISFSIDLHRINPWDLIDDLNF